MLGHLAIRAIQVGPAFAVSGTVRLENVLPVFIASSVLGAKCGLGGVYVPGEDRNHPLRGHKVVDRGHNELLVPNKNNVPLRGALGPIPLSL